MRYVRMAARSVDTTLLEDATRRGEFRVSGAGGYADGGYARGEGRKEIEKGVRELAIGFCTRYMHDTLQEIYFM